jgi:hypothetical protein
MPRPSKIGAANLSAFGFSGGTSVTASYLVVAGGGSGGQASNFTNGTSGGGGAGGYLTGTTSLNPTLSYSVIIGAGGAAVTGTGSTNTNGNNGNNSQFGTLTAAVGGGAGGGNASSVAGTGGSGGGSSYAGTAGPGTPGQGNAGGNGGSGVGDYAAGGGGGAGAAGGNHSGNTGGAGGAGSASSISGTSTYYAGGGGAGAAAAATLGSGGTGGGGAGGAYQSNGVNGTSNTGGGGGASGAGNAATTVTSGAGGSGVVIISYAGAQQFGGGVVTSSGGNTIHTFNTSGTLVPLSSLTASYLIVGGGGSGGSAGGGAGGFVTGSGAILDTNSTYLVTVGAGGAGSGVGTNGANSSLSVVTTIAIGGGVGGGYVPSTAAGAAGNGGSGGGAGAGGVSNPAGTGTPGQGNSGGSNGYTTSPYFGGGGGGAGAVGGNSSSGGAGAGGVGLTSSISGTSKYYAGGGGGGSFYASGAQGAGGNGGGGTGYGLYGTGTAGTANLGGGGGGADSITGGGGGSGGSGVVIISYPGTTQQMAGGTVTIANNSVIHTFTSTGALTPFKFANNSLRFRASASAYLNRTFTTPTSAQKFTWSGWVKRGAIGTNGYGVLFANSPMTFAFNSQTYSQGSYPDDTLLLWDFGSNTYFAYCNPNPVWRDPAAWYHIVLSVDTTQATASNRVKIYVNGVNYPTTVTISQNANLITAASHQIGKSFYGPVPAYYDGEMTEINFIDGQALTQNSFGTFNSYGVWQPISYAGSYGTNGFYLPFNLGTSTYAANLTGSNYVTAPSNAAFAIGTSNFTMETWFYPTNSSQSGQFFFVASSGIQMGYQNSSTWGLCQANVSWQLTTGTLPTQNAWNHIAIVRSGTGSNQTAIFLNGVRVAQGTISTSYSQNTCLIGQGIIGYMSNTRMVKGTAVYDPSAATITVPTAPLSNIANTSVLTYQNSTNIDNSTNAFTLTATGTVSDYVAYPFNLGNIPDYSPAGNNWAANNIQPIAGSGMDLMTDVPTLTSNTASNYGTLNPLSSGATLSNGNLTYLATSGGSAAFGTYGMTGTNKYYFEVNVDSVSTNANIGIINETFAFSPSNSVNWGSQSVAYRNNGQQYLNGSYSSYGATYTTGDVIGVAVDCGAGTVTFYKNGTSQGAITSSTINGHTNFALAGQNVGATPQYSFNFGQQPFVYTPPSGYVALNTYNL